MMKHATSIVLLVTLPVILTTPALGEESIPGPKGSEDGAVEDADQDQSAAGSEGAAEEAVDGEGPEGAKSEGDVAKGVQNPVADLISFPFQNNTNFKSGPEEEVQNVLNIQPVIPISMGKHLNLITRTILPVIAQPEIIPGNGRTAGLGDLTFSAFVAPDWKYPVVFGVGPVFLFPTATDDTLGTGKFGIGPSAVIVAMLDKWVFGAIANNIWSYAGDEDRNDVNLFLLQYFVNYNLPKGWYLTSAPIITANWENSGDERWVLPFGAGVGKVFFAGPLPINISVQGYYNVLDTTMSGTWQLRTQLQFVFPKAMFKKKKNKKEKEKEGV
jgi:hypothetical protein